MNNLPLFWAASAFGSSRNWLLATAITLVFAALGRAVRGVTTSGAVAGAMVCFCLIAGAGWSGFFTLCVVFCLTWLATRFGSARKQRLGKAEARSGRNALQVLANIGVAAACSLAYLRFGDPRLLVSAAAALTEAAADTVSSEIGQAVGGAPRLVTNWKQVAIGTDGALTIQGTLAGCIAGFIVAATCALGGMIRWREFPLCFVAGIAGMLVDSLLGATLERRHLLNNNGVNFASTAFTAIFAWVLL